MASADIGEQMPWTLNGGRQGGASAAALCSPAFEKLEIPTIAAVNGFARRL